MFFNLNDLASKTLPDTARKQTWFRQVAFRQAVSAAIDREGIVRLVYRGRAAPLWGHVPPGNKLWINRSIPQPGRSLERARRLLQTAGFTWKPDVTLVDGRGDAVEFTIVTNTGNAERGQMATIIQDDLKQLGMNVHVAVLELRALVDRLTRTYDYEACVLGLGSGDADPNAEMSVWLSSGGTHLWSPAQTKPATRGRPTSAHSCGRLATLDSGARKRLCDRVQLLVAESAPFIFLVSPNVLVGAHKGLGVSARGTRSPRPLERRGALLARETTQCHPVRKAPARVGAEAPRLRQTVPILGGTTKILSGRVLAATSRPGRRSSTSTTRSSASRWRARRWTCSGRRSWRARPTRRRTSPP